MFIGRSPDSMSFKVFSCWRFNASKMIQSCTKRIDRCRSRVLLGGASRPILSSFEKSEHSFLLICGPSDGCTEASFPSFQRRRRLYPKKRSSWKVRNHSLTPSFVIPVYDYRSIIDYWITGAVAGGHRAQWLQQRQALFPWLPPVDDDVAVVPFYDQNGVPRNHLARDRIQNHYGWDLFITLSSARTIDKEVGLIGKRPNPVPMQKGRSKLNHGNQQKHQVICTPKKTPTHTIKYFRPYY